jgi:hypothetical protein
MFAAEIRTDDLPITSQSPTFQLDPSADPVQANGIPCAFAEYLVQRDGDWERVERGLPGRRERIRSVLEGSTK